MSGGAASQPRGKARLGVALLAGLTALLCLGALSFVFFGHQGLYQVYLLRQEKARLDLENHRLAEENTRLARIIDRLYHDEEMIQDLIRRELNFLKKNEIIIQMPPKGEEVPSLAALLPDRPAPVHPSKSPASTRPRSAGPAAEAKKPHP